MNFTTPDVCCLLLVINIRCTPDSLRMADWHTEENEALWLRMYPDAESHKAALKIFNKVVICYDRPTWVAEGSQCVCVCVCRGVRGNDWVCDQRGRLVW